jgi:hypothetical protein
MHLAKAKAMDAPDEPHAPSEVATKVSVHSRVQVCLRALVCVSVCMLVSAKVSASWEAPGDPHQFHPMLPDGPNKFSQTPQSHRRLPEEGDLAECCDDAPHSAIVRHT